jgi:hypothetical protein
MPSQVPGERLFFKTGTDTRQMGVETLKTARGDEMRAGGTATTTAR